MQRYRSNGSSARLETSGHGGIRDAPQHLRLQRVPARRRREAVRPSMRTHILILVHRSISRTWKVANQRILRGQRPSDKKARSVLGMHADGLSYRLIARNLGLSKNTVMAIVKRGL